MPSFQFSNYFTIIKSSSSLFGIYRITNSSSTSSQLNRVTMASKCILSFLRTRGKRSIPLFTQYSQVYTGRFINYPRKKNHPNAQRYNKSGHIVTVTQRTVTQPTLTERLLLVGRPLYPTLSQRCNHPKAQHARDEDSAKPQGCPGPTTGVAPHRASVRPTSSKGSSARHRSCPTQ